MEDPVFGTLTYEGRQEWQATNVLFAPNQTVQVSIFENKGEPPESSTARARELFRRLQESAPEIRQAVAGDLLETLNEVWNEGDPIGEQEFINRITLKSVWLSEDNDTRLFYDDGDLFGGHIIVVTTDSEMKLNRANLAG